MYLVGLVEVVEGGGAGEKGFSAMMVFAVC